MNTLFAQRSKEFCYLTTILEKYLEELLNTRFLAIVKMSYLEELLNTKSALPGVYHCL
jgi:hypothetical protein